MRVLLIFGYIMIGFCVGFVAKSWHGQQEIEHAVFANTMSMLIRENAVVNGYHKTNGTCASVLFGDEGQEYLQETLLRNGFTAEELRISAEDLSCMGYLATQE